MASCSLKSSTFAGAKYSGATDYKGAAIKDSDVDVAKGAATYVDDCSENNIASD